MHRYIHLADFSGSRVVAEGSRSRRTRVRAAAAAVFLLVAALVIILRQGHGRAQLEIEADSFWLSASDSGVVQRAEGASATAGLPVAVPYGVRQTLALTQGPDDGVLIAVGTTGTVARVDAASANRATTGPMVPRRSFADAGSRLSIAISRAGEAYLLDGNIGSLVRVDATTLRIRRSVNTRGLPASDLWSDDAGQVWVGLARQGAVASLAGDTLDVPHQVTRPGGQLGVVTAAGHPWALDVSGNRLVPLRGTRGVLTLPASVRGDDLAAAMARLPRGDAGPVVPLVVSGARVLLVDTAHRRVRAVRLPAGLPGSGLGAPAMQGAVLYIPDNQTGRVLALDSRTGRTLAVTTLGAPGADIALTTRGLLLWANDRHSGQASVTYQGRTRAIHLRSLSPATLGPAPLPPSITPAPGPTVVPAPVAATAESAKPAATTRATVPPPSPPAPRSASNTAASPSPSTSPALPRQTRPSQTDPQPAHPAGDQRPSPPAAKPPPVPTGERGTRPSQGQPPPTPPSSEDSGGASRPGRTPPPSPTSTEVGTGTVPPGSRPPGSLQVRPSGDHLVDVTITAPGGVPASGATLSVSPDATIVSTTSNGFRVRVPDCGKRNYSVTFLDPAVAAVSHDAYGCERPGQLANPHIVTGNGFFDLTFTPESGGPPEQVCFSYFYMLQSGGGTFPEDGCTQPSHSGDWDSLAPDGLVHFDVRLGMGTYVTRFQYSVCNAAGCSSYGADTIVAWTKPPCDDCTYAHVEDLPVLDAPGGSPTGVLLPGTPQNTWGVPVHVLCQTTGPYQPTGSDGISQWWDKVTVDGVDGFVPDIYVSTPMSRANQPSPNIPSC